MSISADEAAAFHARLAFLVGANGGARVAAAIGTGHSHVCHLRKRTPSRRIYDAVMALPDTIEGRVSLSQMPIDQELAAMVTIQRAVDGLDAAAKQRVLAWARGRYGA